MFGCNWGIVVCLGAVKKVSSPDFIFFGGYDEADF